MGVIGQLPHELPGRETTTGEPPWRTGPAAGELPTLSAPGAHSVSVTVPLPGSESARPDEADGDDQPT